MLEAGIVTADAGPLLAFYRDAFRFDVVDQHRFPQGTVHRLGRDGARLKLFEPAGGARASALTEPWHRDAGFAYAALGVDDLDAAHEAVTAAGGQVLVEPTRHRPGARFALVTDPQGNVWELLEERP